MTKVRQDAWSHEDDLLLAETVLRHIREGSTQLNAFEEVGDLLNRTSAACGFRWNAEVRPFYDKAVENAKKQRKEKKRKEAKASSLVPVTPTENRTQEKEALSLQEIIEALENWNKDQKTFSEEEGRKLHEENKKLKKDLEALREEYRSFVKALDQAKERFTEEDQEDPPFFRLDEEGNAQPM
ncbi:RsfA family transcriptional regulator [Salimicrobium halophilum]|uniref:Prespore-specific regulator n=1 Tax=Salimicrobium halophilum TaxID=86666 RepID=A0A1G8PLI9_9BACI|nr:RsfA family transcriptional regulator [Salimicrobium halophilum]SDI93411.1 prespore-specific regulator [Salimicrobium halophilum]